MELDDFTACWKWPPSSITDIAEHDVQCCPPFATEHHSQCWRAPVEFCLSRLLWCKVCSCTPSPPSTPKERNLEMTSLKIGRPHVLWKECLVVKQKLTWWKHVPLSAICGGCRKLLKHGNDMNRQGFWSKFHLLLIICSRIIGTNKLGILYESPYTKGNNHPSMYGATAPSRPWAPSKNASIHPCFQLFSSKGNNIGYVFEATCSKISVTFSILTVYSLLHLTRRQNLFWMSLTFLYQFLKSYNANFLL